MSQVATEKRNWLDQIKDDAVRITLRRLEDAKALESVKEAEKVEKPVVSKK